MKILLSLAIVLISEMAFSSENLLPEYQNRFLREHMYQTYFDKPIAVKNTPLVETINVWFQPTGYLHSIKYPQLKSLGTVQIFNNGELTLSYILEAIKLSQGYQVFVPESLKPQLNKSIKLNQDKNQIEDIVGYLQAVSNVYVHVHQEGKSIVVMPKEVL